MNKEMLNLVEALKNCTKNKTVRYHIYGVIDQDPGDSSDLNDVLDCLRGYGTADVIHVEVVDGKNH